MSNLPRRKRNFTTYKAHVQKMLRKANERNARHAAYQVGEWRPDPQPKGRPHARQGGLVVFTHHALPLHRRRA